MRNAVLRGFAVISTLGLGAAGCGDDDSDTVTDPADSVVHVTTSVTKGGDTINSITVKVRAVTDSRTAKLGEESLSGAENVKISLTDPSQNTTPIQASKTELTVNADKSVTLVKPITVNQLGVYTLTVTGPVTFTNKGSNSGSLKVDKIVVQFERTNPGDLRIPTEVTTTLPTGANASTLNNGSTFKGLPSGTFIEGKLITPTVTLTKKVKSDGAETKINDLAGGLKTAQIQGCTLQFKTTSK